MANCVHCGKPAGVFRRYHAECRAKHEFAIRAIPAFFEKALHSSVPADRFDQLLQDAAEASYVSRGQFRSLAIAGIASMAKSATAHDLPTRAQEDRIIEIADAVGLALDAVPEADATLIKANILRDLSAGVIPDRVTVVGPLPADVGRDEDVIWIFNRAKPYRAPRPKGQPARPPALPAISDLPEYYPPASLAEDWSHAKGLIEETAGDLIVTTTQLVMVWNDRTRSYPYRKIAGFRPHPKGFVIARGAADSRIILFMVDDAWFAANLVARMLRLNASSDPGEADTDHEIPLSDDDA